MQSVVLEPFARKLRQFDSYVNDDLDRDESDALQTAFSA
jgi:hypothetical protein